MKYMEHNRYNIKEYKTKQYNAMQYNTISCNAKQCTTKQYYTIQSNTIQWVTKQINMHDWSYDIECPTQCVLFFFISIW